MLLLFIGISVAVGQIFTECSSDVNCSGLCQSPVQCQILNGTSTPGCSLSTDCVCCLLPEQQCSSLVCSTLSGTCHPGNSSVCGENSLELYGLDVCGEECQCCTEIQCENISDQNCDGSCTGDCPDSCTFNTTQCSGSTECGCCTCPEIEVEDVCGNGVVESPEECDDGNSVNGDGCNAFCQSELCPQILAQSGLENKNCLATMFTSTVASSTVCHSVDGESLKVDCETEQATLYLEENCQGEVLHTMPLANCFSSDGLFSNNGYIAWYAASSCYGPCQVSNIDLNSFLNNELSGNGIAAVESRKISSDGQVILATIFLILILIFMIFVALWWNSRRGEGEMEVESEASILTRISAARPGSFDDDMAMNPHEVQAFMKRGKLM